MRSRNLAAILAVALLAFCSAHAQWVELNPVTAVQKQADGVQFSTRTGTLTIQVFSNSTIHVSYWVSPLPQRPDFVVIKHSWPASPWTMTSGTDDVVISTTALTITVKLSNGAITFATKGGSKLFGDDGRTLTPVEVNGEKTYHAEMFSNLWGSEEAFYGLGQHQAGVWNYRGEAVDLSQDNTNISIPVFLSSRGYGIFWNNSSRSRFNNRFLNSLYLSSEVADSIDYYFLYGPEFDSIIGAYRELTGAVPLFAKWVYGFWQCKNRYQTQQELLAVAAKYRELHIPADGIVQDWFWWKTMGEPEWDASRYPAPAAMLEELHRQHFGFMISVWPYFRPGSQTYDEMNRRGFLIAKTKVAGFHPAGQALYDAFSTDARKLYWKLMDDALFGIGVDAWWLDTTEPETEGRETNILVTSQTAAGSGARYANLFPLLTTTAVHDGQRASNEEKRVFILSRSAFAGSQRNGVAVWSGDINSDWVFFRKQIPAGLNYSLSGLPYWTTDIGGFIGGNPGDPAYRELFLRWFQFGVFNPILRVHGTRTTNENELWSYGPDAQKILVAFDTLRYRLLPYIYSLAWETTHAGYTPMRALAMDFRTDARAANIGDQFMFGPAFLVSPVLEPEASMRHLYLPVGRWYDFWSGSSLQGGRAVDVAAPLQQIPLHVRAGSIVPLGPAMEYATEKPEDPIELRVFTGADATFTLYEDENDGYAYERGLYSTIPIRWSEGERKLTIGTRSGHFPRMLETRIFRVVFVSENHGTGIAPLDPPDRTIRYTGATVDVRP
jgi:alpha-D-xyloside xylohydrolase